jgi:hypothetical protein
MFTLFTVIEVGAVCLVIGIIIGLYWSQQSAKALGIRFKDNNWEYVGHEKHGTVDYTMIVRNTSGEEWRLRGFGIVWRDPQTGKLLDILTYGQKFSALYTKHIEWQKK